MAGKAVPREEGREALAEPEEREEPITGNCFVAAYPPFSCWAASAADDVERVAATPAEPETPFGLYVHIPFCAQRCSFCYYLSYDDRGGQVDPYLDALVREWRNLARKPALDGRALDVVYFGGGTPSLLSGPRLGRLLRDLQRIRPWSAVREVTFECAPKTVTPAKLRLLRDAGVNRVSLGVQQMDDHVLERNGRIHKSGDVERAYALIRREGFDRVNLDLMVGMVGETDASFGRTVRRAIEMAPENITVYQTEIPANTPLYRQVTEGCVPGGLPDWPTKRRRLAWAFRELEAAGYRVTSAYGAARDPARDRFLYASEQFRGGDMVGIGASALSYLQGVHSQNQPSLRRYLAAMREAPERLPVGRGYVLSDQERLVRELVLQLKLGEVALAPFERKHGVDVRRRFQRPLERLEGKGYLRVDGRRVALTRAGLLRADRLLPAFYLPEHQEVSYW